MIFLLNMIVGLTLVIFQTAFVPWIPLTRNFFDLALPFVVYQGVFRPAREGLILVLGLGLLVDQLSGAPVGLPVVIYLWVWIGVRWGLRFFHMGNYYLVPFVVALAVLLENTLFSLAIITSAKGSTLSMVAGGKIARQVGWAIVSAPLFIMLLNAIHRGWAAWIAGVNSEKNDAIHG